MRAILLNQAVCALYLVTVWSSALSAVITRPPGELTVLDGATLSLTWHVSASDADIKWCYWRFRPDNDLSKPWLKLLGWDNINKEVIPYDDGGPGDWEVIGEQPCSTGVRARSTADYQGTYQYGLIQQDGIEHVSQPLTVTVKQDDKLSYVIAIAGHSYYMMVNIPSRTLSRSVSITAGDNITLSANMDWEGATGNISFYKVVADQNEHLHTCRHAAWCDKGVKLGNGEDNMSIVVGINANVQGIEPMLLTQPVLVEAAVTHTNVPAIILGILFLLSVIAVAVLWLFRRRMCSRSTLRSKIFCDGEENIINATSRASSACILPHDERETEQPKAEQTQQIDSLNTKITKMQADYEERLKHAAEEHRSIIDEKDRLIDKKEDELNTVKEAKSKPDKLNEDSMCALKGEIERLLTRNKKLEAGSSGDDRVKAATAQYNNMVKEANHELANKNDEIKQWKGKCEDLQRELKLNSSKPAKNTTYTSKGHSDKEVIEEAQEAQPLVDTNNDETENDHSLPMRQLKDMMHTYLKHREEYGLPLIKDKAQVLLGEMADTLSLIVHRRKTNLDNRELATYEREVNTQLRIVGSIMKDASPTSWQYNAMNNIDPIMATMRTYQEQLERMEETTEREQDDIISKVRGKLVDWNDISRKIAKEMVIQKWNLPEKKSSLDDRLSKVQTGWNSLTKRNAYLLTDPVNKMAGEATAQELTTDTAVLDHYGSNEHLSTLGYGDGSHRPVDI